jgi:beta-1,4-mannooligosaccharide/beta-1,4-mannosyl-N-acetylglucosamine phosphorylase
MPAVGISWQDRPAGLSDVVWRFSDNLIVRRDAIPSSNSVF